MALSRSSPSIKTASDSLALKSKGPQMRPFFMYSIVSAGTPTVVPCVLYFSSITLGGTAMFNAVCWLKCEPVEFGLFGP
jgi:hypothetical protein